MCDSPSERIIRSKVTYTVEIGGKVFVVENVPARVCVETGEQFFDPETVEKPHRIVVGGGPPIRVISANVFEFAA